MRLIDFFIPLITKVLRLTGDEATAASQVYQDIRSEFETAIRKAETSARQAGFDPADVQSAKFAVAAFVDESILLSSWEGKDEWSIQPFGRLFFNTGNAGVEFFTRLQELPAGKRQVREVFGLCLALGFKGRYYDEEQAPELQKAAFENLEAIFGRPVKNLDMGVLRIFPEAYPNSQTRRRARLWRSLNPLNLILFFAPVILYLTLYVMYRFYLGKTILDFFSPSV